MANMIVVICTTNEQLDELRRRYKRGRTLSSDTYRRIISGSSRVVASRIDLATGCIQAMRGDISEERIRWFYTTHVEVDKIVRFEEFRLTQSGKLSLNV